MRLTAFLCIIVIMDHLLNTNGGTHDAIRLMLGYESTPFDAVLPDPKYYHLALAIVHV